MSISPAVAHHRASLARRKQSYPEDHPKVLEARQNLAYAGLADHAARIVADWPTPTDEQLARVASILRTCGSPPGASAEPASGGGTSTETLVKAASSRSELIEKRLAELDGGAA